MNGYLRLCFVNLVLVETLSTAPASSNPLADIFNTAAPQRAATSPPHRNAWDALATRPL